MSPSWGWLWWRSLPVVWQGSIGGSCLVSADKYAVGLRAIIQGYDPWQAFLSDLYAFSYGSEWINGADQTLLPANMRGVCRNSLCSSPPWFGVDITSSAYSAEVDRCLALAKTPSAAALADAANLVTVTYNYPSGDPVAWMKAELDAGHPVVSGVLNRGHSICLMDYDNSIGSALGPDTMSRNNALLMDECQWAWTVLQPQASVVNVVIKGATLGPPQTRILKPVGNLQAMVDINLIKAQAAALDPANPPSLISAQSLAALTAQLVTDIGGTSTPPATQPPPPTSTGAWTLCAVGSTIQALGHTWGILGDGSLWYMLDGTRVPGGLWGHTLAFDGTTLVVKHADTYWFAWNGSGWVNALSHP